MDRTDLRRVSDFSRLWLGQSISLAGSQITLLALPLAAVLQFHASAAALGLLRAAAVLPFPLLGLFAGALVDRSDRRRLLVGADAARALALGSIPVMALLGILHLEQLYVVALAAGVLTTLFEVAYQSFVPMLVAPTALVVANSRLEGSVAVARVAGPAVAGELVQMVSAPIAIAVDSISFLFSALCVWSIRGYRRETRLAVRAPLLAAVRDGLGLLLGDPNLRAITICTAGWNLAFQSSVVAYIIFVLNVLHVSPALLGVVYAAGGGASILAALTATRLAVGLGLGHALVVAILVATIGYALPALAPLAFVWALPMLLAGQVLAGFGVPVYNINQLTLRQSSTPASMQGRVHASFRVIVWGVQPLGAVLGGWLGSTLGSRQTLFVSAGWMMLATLWLALSSARRLGSVTRAVT